MIKALLVIDWEKEWIDRSSEYYIGSNLSSETETINTLIRFARIEKFKIIFIKHVELEGSAFKDNSSSSEFIDGLDIQSSDTIIKKNKISPFYETSLERELTGTEGLIVAGILTNLCVRSAVEDAYDRGYNIEIVTDCCVAFDTETHEFTLRDLKQTRPEINIVSLQGLTK